MAKLKEEVAEITGELAEMEAQKAELTKTRQEEASEYAKAHSELSQSKEALANAITVLSEYYSGNKAEALVQQPAYGGEVFGGEYQSKAGGASGIIGLLETTEAEVSQSMADRKSNEESAAAEYEKFMQECEVNKASKEAERKGKEDEIKRFATQLSEHKSDMESASKELQATLDYLEKVADQCTHKPMTFEERAAKRQAEIDGLKEALDILSNDVAGGEAFLQVRVHRRQ